ncbi:MAG: hypothetical protein WA919_23915 [Coleofasciculaceae cyanobacterium]
MGLRWDYELRYQILEEFLTIPGAFELIEMGLEQLFSSNFTQQQRKRASGFFELVAEQSRATSNRRMSRL